MARKFLGYDTVLDTNTRGVAADKILVKLRRGDKKPRWVLMSRADYKRRAVLR